MNKRIFTATAAFAAIAHANAPKKVEGVAGAADAAKTKQDRIAPVMTGVVAGIEIPTGADVARGSKSPYPFSTLNVGESFGIKNKTAKQMSSIVSNQNRAKANQTPKKDAAGNIVYKMTELKDAAGTVIGKTPTTEPETEWVKEFRAYDVNAALADKIKGSALEGSTVLIFRVK